MPEIRLTPHGQLDWEAGEDATPAALKPVRAAFERDWRAGLFALAARQAPAGSSLTLGYWRRIAERDLTRLCHLPGDTSRIELEPPTEAERAEWVLSAPPMTGGEYLSPERLAELWHAWIAWVQEAVREAGELATFLAREAPAWQQVGRVTFHLAENKNDPEHPFAFLATYTTGFGAGGRLKHLPLGRALEQYSGDRNKPALIKLLTPVHEAAKRCAWVRELVDSARIYQPETWTAQAAHTFLRSTDELEASGLAVRVPDWWKKRPRPQVAVTIDTASASPLGAEALMDFDVEVAVGEATLSRSEIEQLLAAGDGLVLVKGQWVEIDRQRLHAALEHWETVKAQAEAGEISFIEGMRLLAGASADLKHEEEADAERTWAFVQPGEAMRQALERLRDPSRLQGLEPGQGLEATLRPYQREGVAWLDFLSQLGLGACLADDMGLGKTLQVLALLLNQKQARSGPAPAPSLLVVPASLLGNWRQEAERFTPTLVLETAHPSETPRPRLARIAEQPAEALAGVDLVLTTYAMLTRQPWLAEVTWQRVILDEAQAIKNPGTRQCKAAKKLKAQSRIALTGTPVENRLGDLWSLFDFLNPGLLGSAQVFKAFVKQLEQREHDQFAPLRRLVGPYILRRLKTDRAIIADLPEKTETTRYCTLTRKQARQYAQVVRAMEAALGKAGDAMGRRGLVLQTLMRLKQVCNHPSQLTGDGEYPPAASGKFARLAALGEEIAERQEKALVFTQFREIIDPLAEHLARIFGRTGLILHGGTRVAERRKIVEAFQAETGPPFLLLSLKAGGTGLNLTAASHVIHFDRWWNPAVENQATDRAFRIGQQRNVLVHKFVTRGTVEERIDAMIQSKRELAEQLLPAGSGEVNLTELDDEALMDLVKLDANQAAAD